MQPMPDYSISVSEKLKSLTASGSLQVDAAQMDVAKHLDRVLAALKQRRPAAKSSALGWLFAARKKPEPIRGLYIHGSVGRGKTMLMDMFFAMAPSKKKRRAHFHEFMADVHNRIAAHRLKIKNGETKLADPVPPVAADLFAEAELLCFDEFSVTDIADAMILSRLFSELFSLGCVLVTTSNVEPDNLYRDGLNRSLFTPFITLLKTYVDVVTLDSPTDYRMEKDDSQPVYLTPLNAETDRAMDAAWARALHGRTAQPTEIPRKGRVVHVPAAVDRLARFSFADLCEAPLGAGDFLAIAARFDTIFIDHIPELGPEKRNQTKRFIILIDTLYDHATHVTISAAAMPEALLVQRRGTEGFEFDRTASRLFEMRSAEYLAQIRNRSAAE
ncbi:cell division protein ZapE [Rhizobium sp. HT1-10]|uniref:cell division protein ZapE n=1 Tax=Rhizobium sp. HT1-10 TaxID=3111638 RepID=UPI003C220832